MLAVCALGLIGAVPVAGEFVVNTVDLNGAYVCPLAVNSVGNPILAYQANSASFNGVRFTEVTDPNYQKTNVFDTAPAILTNRCDLAVNSQGEIAIVYADDNGLHFALKTNWSDWTEIQIDDVDCESLALAFGSNDVPHVLYSEDGGQLKYATYDRMTNQWVTQYFFVEQGSHLSIAVDSDENIWFAYRISTEEEIRVARKSGENGSWMWLCAWEGDYPSLAINPDGMPCVAYVYSDQLFYTVYIGSWNTTTVYDGAGGPVAPTRPSLAFDNNGNGAIAYRREMQLRLATNQTGWNHAVVDTGVTANAINLVFDDDNQPLIAFFDKAGSPETASIKLAGLSLTATSPADLNDDGAVDLWDFDILSDGWQGWDPQMPPGDFDESGNTDITDLITFNAWWLWQR